jgi:site-specific DNA recombinase
MKANSVVARPVGIWIRVSTEDQAKGESPEHHKARAVEYAKWNGWDVKEVYDLSGVSGKTVMDHPEAKRMLSDIKRGHITALTFSKLARLARNTRELLDFADLFRQAGADMVSLQEKIDTSTPAGRLFYTMIAALSQWEREEITDRIKASILVRAKLGKSLGGAAPFGYMWKDKHLVVNPTEAPVRKLMYELFVEDKRRKSVARKLNDQGYRTRNGSKFTDTTVVRLLQDTTAKGLYRSNHTYRDQHRKLLMKPETEWVHSPVEAVVSEELWDRCNRLLEKRKDTRPPGPKPVHLFAGLLHCGCGHKMYVFSRTPKYVCLKCRNKIPIEDIESIFRSQLEEFFISKEKVEKHLSSANLTLTEKKERLAAHITQLEKVRGEMKKVYHLYQTDAVTPAIFGKLYRPLEEQEQSLALELPRLEGEIDALEIRQVSSADIIDEATNLQKLWPKLTASEKRRIVESVTKTITVSAGEVDITFWAADSCEELTKGQRNVSDSWPR